MKVVQCFGSKFTQYGSGSSPGPVTDSDPHLDFLNNFSVKFFIQNAICFFSNPLKRMFRPQEKFFKNEISSFCPFLRTILACLDLGPNWEAIKR
jgi:hypothetical protein